MDGGSLAKIPGGAELCRWFGGVPSFHDAEVLDLHLSRAGPSRLRLHAWIMGKDAEGFFVREKQAVVAFVLEGVTALELSEFNHQNVIYGLSVGEAPDGWMLTLEPCYGLSGSLTARQLRVEFQPGAPEGAAA